MRFTCSHRHKYNLIFKYWPVSYTMQTKITLTLLTSSALELQFFNISIPYQMFAHKTFTVVLITIRAVTLALSFSKRIIKWNNNMYNEKQPMCNVHMKLTWLYHWCIIFFSCELFGHLFWIPTFCIGQMYVLSRSTGTAISLLSMHKP